MFISRSLKLLSVTLLLANVFAPMILVVNVTAQEAPRGPWVDKVVFTKEAEPAKAIEMLLKGDIHAYFDDIEDPELFKKIRESGLAYDISYGSYYDLTFNPVGPEFPNPKAEVIFNPFANPRIREAMNYIMDRDYIANEILGGLAIPRYTALTPSFSDYARYADVVMEIENEYRYDFEKGKSIIYEEMVKMGAEMSEGKWYYKGQPIKLIFLIRVEDVRRPIGDYVASQLEKLGFEVEKVYGKAADLSPLWMRGDPKEGRWHLYTGGWITLAVSRDESDNFGFFYTKLGMPVPLWQAYVNEPEFYIVAERLWNRDYKSMEERDELMKKALLLSMKEAQRIWLVHLTSVWARRPEVAIAYDLAGGYPGSALWPYTIRFADSVGGVIRIAQPNILVDPWNPVGGSNWIWDQDIIRATGESATIADPYTGLFHPLRVRRAELYVVKDLEGQIRATLPWVELKFVENITVPPDAWWRFNSTTGTIETVPPDTRAKVKVVIHYQENLFEKYKWHDGSTFSLADMVYSFLLTFDRVNPASPLYDEAALPAFEAWFALFRGLRIASEKPLIIEYYTDTWYIDAEWIASAAANAIWPYYSYGPGPWHVVALLARAEAEGRLTFTADKAEKLKVEWANLIAGPSLEVLAEVLEKCVGEGYVPYEPVLGRYVSKDEAVQRYRNLKSWYDVRKHFWVGNGPFYLESVDVVAEIVTLAAYREYIDRADRWLIFSEPPIPTVGIAAPTAIYPGAEARINLTITRNGVPYELEYIDFVRYVIRHAGGTVAGDARCIADGRCVIVLNGTQTALLVPGPADITVIAVSKLVGKPSIEKAVTRVSTVVDYVALMLARATAEMRAELESLRTGLEEKLATQRGDLDRIAAELEQVRSMLYIAIGLSSIAVVISALSVIQRRLK